MTAQVIKPIPQGLVVCSTSRAISGSNSVGITATAADHPQPPGVRHRRRQSPPDVSPSAPDDRVLDRQQFGEGGLQSHTANRTKEALPRRRC